ncbi:hypothetical protein HEK616_40360 [Streptomyces nigrescens]|uniref:Uncharacterized protein n=1 Tax=Streptomyces nigrescens TaxID=1920 RepID=A0ABM7ZVZ8_STRNI|nr:hypothetical protein [Streptomyces nigrescens]BDM70549.1 hypothetical protein HEK616_40360 [Streptomyces nigrescens]
MRSDHTAHFVATRPYGSDRELMRALNAHARRVCRARREEPDGALAQEPVLVASGNVVFSGEDWECGIGTHQAGAVFHADATTHRVVTRNGEPCGSAWLCVRHWSEYARTDEDGDESPEAEIRFGRS